MKKIKGLLFGILTLLGIGSSFSYFVEFQYFDLSNRYSNFLFNSNGYGGITFSSANGGSFSPLNNIFYTGVNNLSALSYLDISNYSLSSPLSSSFSTASTRKNFRLYLDGNNIAFRFFNINYSPFFNYLLNISNSLTSTNYLLENKSFFVRTLTNDGDGIIFDNPFIQSISPSGNRSWIFIKTGVYDTNLGQYVQDTEYSGVIYNRGTISPGVFFDYSFAITPSMSYNSGSAILSVDYDSIPYLLRTITPGISISDWNSYRGVYILKLDSFYKKTNTGDFSILALSLSGDNYIYSEYTCPSNSFSFGFCSFVDGGYVGQSNLSNSFTSWKNSSFSVRPSTTLNLFRDLSFYLFTPNQISFDATYSDISYYTTNTIYSIRSNNIVFLYRPYGLQDSNGTTAHWSSGVLERSFGLISSDGINILEEYLSQGGGNQSTGNQSVSSLYYSCLGPTYNTPDGRPPVYCFDSNGNFDPDRLRTCFTDYIATGGELQGGLFCNIDGFVQSVVFTGDGSGVSIVPCTSDSCYSSLIIGESYINLNPVNVVTTGLVLDMITNLTGWVGRCPFPYVDFGFGNTFKVFNYFKSLGYNIDPFIPFNCAVAGFHAGRYTIFEDLNLTIFDIPILNGDTEKHKILFRFFDVLIVFAIFGIYRFFRKHI